MAILKQDRPKMLAKFFQRIHEMSQTDRRSLKQAARKAQAGDTGPLIDILSKLFSDPEFVAALVKILVILIPLILAL